MRTPFPEPSEPGYQLAVAPGIHWLRLPLPFKPEDHINVWLLEDERGVAIVDTGLADDESRALWLDALARLGGSRTVDRVFISHHHPDHIGLAAWFEEALGATVCLAAREFEMAGDMMRPDGNDGLVGLYRAHGMPVERPDVAALRHGFYRDHVSRLPRRPRHIQDGERFAWGGTEWVIRLVGGHTPAHALFHCPAKKLLIAGDHVLPEIVTNIGSLSFNQEATPVTDYLDSLDMIEALPADTLVLPAHGQPFTGLPLRCRQLREIQRERLAGVLAACVHADTLWAMLPHVYGRDLFGLKAVLGFNQTKAYLDCLVDQGRLAVGPDESGMFRYRQVASA